MVEKFYPSWSAYTSVTLDLTISCPFLKAHFKKAVLDASSLFLTRETDKNLRHLEGEIAQGRVFMAFVLSTLGGIGPPSTVEWIDSLFSESRSQEF